MTAVPVPGGRVREVNGQGRSAHVHDAPIADRANNGLRLLPLLRPGRGPGPQIDRLRRGGAGA